LLSTGSAYSEGKIVYQQDFSGIKDGTDLSELGWSVDASEEQSLWKVKDGYLEVTCLHNPYNGGVVRKKAPLIRRGMLEFDANIAMNGKDNAKGSAFTMEIYNIGTASDDEGFERDFSIALVYSGNMADHEFMENVVVNRGYNLRVFEDIEETISWLPQNITTT